MFVDQLSKVCPHFKSMPVHDTVEFFLSANFSLYPDLQSISLFIKYIWIYINIIPLAVVWWSHLSTVILSLKMFSFSGLSNQIAIVPDLQQSPSYIAVSKSASLCPLNVMSFILFSPTTTFWLHKDSWQHKKETTGLESHELILVASFFKKSFLIRCRYYSLNDTGFYFGSDVRVNAIWVFSEQCFKGSYT